ncbi:hypothetical protein N9R46_00360 [Gammaproteobacteria bacterium]|nr:hypothetical protein [Gammaproteobacteria bacterium]
MTKNTKTTNNDEESEPTMKLFWALIFTAVFFISLESASLADGFLFAATLILIVISGGGALLLILSILADIYDYFS